MRIARFRGVLNVPFSRENTTIEIEIGFNFKKWKFWYDVELLNINRANVSIHAFNKQIGYKQIYQK